MGKNLREQSRNVQWESTSENPTTEQINCGSFLRIADSMELMSKNYVSMQNDLEWYKRNYKERGERIEKLSRSNAALRGHIKRLKAKQ